VFGAAVVAALATPPGSQLVLVLELIAFVLEAILLLAILFGWPAHARRSHFIATLVLAVGSVLFALVWPGAQIPDHLPRLLLSAYLATALLVAAVAAWQLMSDPQDDAACIAQKMAVGMFVACAPLMIALDAAPQLRLGVWVGGAVLLVGVWGGLLIWRGSPERSQVFLAACVGMAPASLFSAGVGWVGQ
jgi:cytochrome bd-type quinol oxidase subunit 1